MPAASADNSLGRHMLRLVDKIAHEAKWLEDQCAGHALQHRYDALYWSRWHDRLGVFTILLAFGASAVAVSGFPNANTIAAASALVVALLTGVITFLNPKDRAVAHEGAERRLGAIRDQAHILHHIECQQSTPELLTALLKGLVKEKGELEQHLPPVSKRIQQICPLPDSTQISATSGELSTTGGEVSLFDNVAQLYGFIAQKIESAEVSIDDITWGSRTEYRTPEEKDAYEKYLKSVEAVCGKGKIKYREISSLTNAHYYERARNLIDKGYYSYHLGYYEISSIPMISYIIIDSRQVMLGFYRAPILPVDKEVYLSITTPLFVQLFIDYYDTLWQGAKKLKEGNTIDRTALDEIKRKLDTPKGR